MDRSGHALSSLDELRQIQDEARSSNSLKNLRLYFERVQEVRRIHSGNFDVQIVVAEVQEEIIRRAQEVRRAAGDFGQDSVFAERSSVGERSSVNRTSKTLAEPETTEEAARGGQPLNRKSWKQATILALIFTAAICVVFFYLIQSARRTNFGTPETAHTPTSPAKPATSIPTADNGAPAATVTNSSALRLYTDLMPGTISVDDGEPQDLKDGELVLDHLEPGRHSIKLAGRSGTADFSFSVAADAAPEVEGAPAASNALAVLIASQNGKARVITNAQPSELFVDGNSAGAIPPEGLSVDLGAKDHELQIARAKDRQKFVLTYTATPALTVFVKSDPSIGFLTVTTKQDGVAITINDKPYRRPTDHGQIRIPLRSGEYVIRAHKDGFVDPPSQHVEVTKGEDSELAFEMTPTPDVATLQIRGAAPGTKVYVDKEFTGTVGPDGNGNFPTVKGGDHTVEFRLEGATTKTVQRKFQAGEIVLLSGPEVALEKEVVESKPAPQPAPPPKAVAPAESNTTVAVSGVQVRRGGGFVPYSAPKIPGRYTFEAHSKLGGLLKHGKLQWYAGYEDSQNYVLFSVDGKHASVREMRDGKMKDLGRVDFDAASDEWVQVDMSVRPETITARVKTREGSWTDLGSINSPGRDFTQDRAGVYIPGNDEVAVSNFRFSGH